MNIDHPEVREGEVFLTNTNIIGDKFKICDVYDNCSWKTKRKGHVAYDKNENVIKGAYPIFIQFKEYKDEYGDRSMIITLLNEKIVNLEAQDKVTAKRMNDLFNTIDTFKIERIEQNRKILDLQRENRELSGFVSGLQFHIEGRNAELKVCRGKVNNLNEELNKIKEATLRYHVKWHSGYNEILYGCGVDGIFKYLDAHPRKGDRIRDIIMMQ
jgi:predicted nuclease with TOPRIM domain